MQFSRVAVGDVLEEISAHGMKKGHIAFKELFLFRPVGALNTIP